MGVDWGVVSCCLCLCRRVGFEARIDRRERGNGNDGGLDDQSLQEQQVNVELLHETMCLVGGPSRALRLQGNYGQNSGLSGSLPRESSLFRDLSTGERPAGSRYELYSIVALRLRQACAGGSGRLVARAIDSL